MDFNNYLKQILKAQTQANTFGSLTTKNVKEQLANISLFDSATVQDFNNLDIDALLKSADVNELNTNTTSQDIKSLNQIVKALTDLEDIQEVMDLDSNGEITEEEVKQFLETIMGQDGNNQDLTMEDIDNALKKMGIDLEAAAEKAVNEILGEEELEETEEVQEAQKASGAGSSGGSGGSSGVSGTSGAGASTKEKTDGETVEEIQSQIDAKNAEIDEVEKDAEAQIAEEEAAKEEAMKQAGVSEKEYEEYKQQQEEIDNQITEKETAISEKDDLINDKQSTIDSNSNYISSIEGQIATNEAQKASISSDDENSSSRIADIDAKISNLEQEKSKVEQENQKLEEEIQQAETEKQQLETEKQELETQKQELLSKTLNESDGFAKGIASSEAVQNIKQNIMESDNRIAEIKAERDSKISTLKSDIQNLEVKLKDAEAKEEREKTLKENSAESGDDTADFALAYDGMTAEEMKQLMREKGYQFDEGAWCADFVSFALSQAQGEENLPDWYKNCGNRAYCPTIENAAQEAGAVVDASEAKVGDAVTFTRNGRSGHIGIITQIDADGTIHTVEGNTSDDNGSYTNGVVNTHTYKASEIRAFLSMS